MSWMNMRLDYYRNRLSMLQIHTAPKISTEIINKKDSLQVRCPKNPKQLHNEHQDVSRGSRKGPIPDHCRVIVSFHSLQDLGSRTVNVRQCLTAWWLRIAQLLRSKSLSGKCACLLQTLPVAQQWNYKSDQVNSWGLFQSVPHPRCVHHLALRSWWCLTSECPAHASLGSKISTMFMRFEEYVCMPAWLSVDLFVRLY